MAYYFTSDTHFGDKNTLIRENRPFSSVEEFDNYVINLWNKQVKSYDTIYHLGDFINYNCDEKESWRKAIKHIQKIKCKLILIIGNNEERLINEQFGNSINEFKKYAKSIGFKDIKKEDIIEFDNKEFYLNHYPSKHKEGYINLFGHTHRATGLWKPFGLNMGCDLNHFQLFSEQEITRILSDKQMYWDTDRDNLSM